MPAYDTKRTFSAMMLMTTFVGCCLHCLIEMVRVDLQPEHRLHIFPSLCDVAGAIVAKMLYALETMLNFVAQGLGEKPDQSIGRTSLDCVLGYRNDRPDIKAS